jgi:hypothetical protein
MEFENCVVGRAHGTPANSGGYFEAIYRNRKAHENNSSCGLC